MTDEPPNLAYYRSCVGRWSGPVRFAITDATALGAGSVGLFDRASVWLMVWSSRLIGPPTMETSVAFVAPDEILHTTRVQKWGLTLFRSVERLTPEPAGREVGMAGEQWPTPWGAVPYEGASATVDEDARGATYRFRALGADLVQQTRWTADGIEVVQRTPFSESVILLRRLPGDGERGRLAAR
jgi:hypothetical protein